MILIKKLAKKLKDKKYQRLLENYLSLSVLQGFNYLLPLIAIPYLVRVLGVEKYGLVMFASAFIKFFMLLIDYGFNLSATREISFNRKDIRKVSEIFWSVIIIKTIIMVFGFCLMVIIILSFNKFKSNWLLYIMGYGMVIGQAYFPIWFFQGMEKMKYITILNVTAKSLFVILIFIVVGKQSDYIYVLLLNSLGFMVAGFISFYIVLRHFKVPVCLPPLKRIISYFNDSTRYFFSQISIMIYSTSNVFFLGIFVNDNAVAYYAAAEQIYKAMQGLFTPIVDVLYPFMSIERNVRLFKKVLFGALVGAVVISLISIAFSTPITQLIFGSGFEKTSFLIKLFSIAIVITAASNMLGYPFLAALGYPNFTNTTIVTGSIIHLFLLFMMIPIINIYLVVMATIITELFILAMKIYGVKKYKLWKYVW